MKIGHIVRKIEFKYNLEESESTVKVSECTIDVSTMWKYNLSIDLISNFSQQMDWEFYNNMTVEKKNL